jgi:hypothetical protein
MTTNDSEQDKDQPKVDELISLNEAANISGLSHDHLRRLAGRGDLWAMKIGRNWVTTEQAVQVYMSLERHSGPKKKD